jgi:hypothetical protein
LASPPKSCPAIINSRTRRRIVCSDFIASARLEFLNHAWQRLCCSIHLQPHPKLLRDQPGSWYNCYPKSICVLISQHRLQETIRMRQPSAGFSEGHETQTGPDPLRSRAVAPRMLPAKTRTPELALARHPARAGEDLKLAARLRNKQWKESRPLATNRGNSNPIQTPKARCGIVPPTNSWRNPPVEIRPSSLPLNELSFGSGS